VALAQWMPSSLKPITEEKKYQHTKLGQNNASNVEQWKTV